MTPFLYIFIAMILFAYLLTVLSEKLAHLLYALNSKNVPVFRLKIFRVKNAQRSKKSSTMAELRLDSEIIGKFRILEKF